MRRLGGAALILAALFGLIVGLMLLVGQLEPPPERVEALHLTDCAPPCWDGITPGVSSLGEVEDRLNTTFPQFKQLSASTLPFQTWLMSQAGDRASINAAIDDGVVVSLSIGADYPGEQMPTLGEALALFGAPSCVLVDDRSIYTTMGYENAAQQVILSFSVSQPSLSNRIRAVSVGLASALDCGQDLAMSWRDFRHSQYSFLFSS